MRTHTIARTDTGTTTAGALKSPPADGTVTGECGGVAAGIPRRRASHLEADPHGDPTGSRRNLARLSRDLNYDNGNVS